MLFLATLLPLRHWSLGQALCMNWERWG